MKDFEHMLSGGDLRSKGQSEAVAGAVKTAQDFEKLFALLFHENRLIVMRAADAVEKLTAAQPEYLKCHNQDVLRLIEEAEHKELKWHLAQLAARIAWTKAELGQVWGMLSAWALDKKESRIVRALSVQAMHDLGRGTPLEEELEEVMASIELEKIPSISARIRLLRKR